MLEKEAYRKLQRYHRLKKLDLHGVYQNQMKILGISTAEKNKAKKSRSGSQESASRRSGSGSEESAGETEMTVTH